MNNYSNVNHEYNPLSYVSDLDKFHKRKMVRIDGIWETSDDIIELNELEVK